MTRYIALLRGINIGKSGRIRMDALKQVFESVGFSNVETYIQSGNVMFDSTLPEKAVRETIEHAMREIAQINTIAVLRTEAELSRLIERCPFSAEEQEEAQRINPESVSLYVCLLPQPPLQEVHDKLYTAPQNGDSFSIIGRDIYLLLQQSLRQSKLAIRVQKAFPDATVRNWNTLSKLNGLCRLLRKENHLS